LKPLITADCFHQRQSIWFQLCLLSKFLCGRHVS
jgi:hypothetical protein